MAFEEVIFDVVIFDEVVFEELNNPHFNIETDSSITKLYATFLNCQADKNCQNIVNFIY